jgi:hypothetical protein
MKRIVVLVFAGMWCFLVAGCASLPLVNKTDKQEVKDDVPIPPTLATPAGKEVTFPPGKKALFIAIKNGDVSLAKRELAAQLVASLQEKCGWKKPLAYYGDKVKVDLIVKEGDRAMYARARLDESLCPEKK